MGMRPIKSEYLMFESFKLDDTSIMISLMHREVTNNYKGLP